jgi:hypothetical protein
MQENKVTRFRLFTLSLLLILLCLPRFNRNPLIIKRGLDDAAYYIAYVEYFRGETPSTILAPASNWRPLIPFLSSLLPFSPLTSINIINIVCLLATLMIFNKILSLLNVKENLIWAGGLMFVLSFPVFYYSTIGYIDPGVLLFCTLGCYLTIQKKWNWLFLIIIFGLLAKETIFVVVPPAIVYLFISTGRTKALIYSFLYILIYVFTTILIHKLAPITNIRFNTTFWHFSNVTFYFNLLRMNVYISFILSLGIPVLIFLLYPLHLHLKLIKRKPYVLTFLAALLTGLAMYVFAFLTASADGRIIWMIYPFIIPYTILLIDNNRITNLTWNKKDNK